MATTVEVQYYNTFWLKKTVYRGTAPFASSIGTPMVYPPVGMGYEATEDPYRGGLGSSFPGLSWRNPGGGTGVAGYPNFPSGCADSDTYGTYQEEENWVIEEARIRGGYNNVSTDYGAKAYLREDENDQEVRPNAMIYSGIYNSRNSINKTNVFSVGEAITKAVDPQKGSIQKLYAEDTNLIVFQEDKVNRALIDKDTIYTSESGTQTQAANVVIGQTVPYVGEFGISKNPESFAVYGFRKYFIDKDRGSVMRLSRDGLTEISEYGMSNFFRDNLQQITEDYKPYDQVFVYGNSQNSPAYPPVFPPDDPYITVTTSPATVPIGAQLIINGASQNIYVRGKAVNFVYLTDWVGFIIPADAEIIFRSATKDKVVGGWDIHNRLYTTSLQNKALNSSQTCDNNTLGYIRSGCYETTTFDESVLGWPSRFTYEPDFVFSLKNNFFSIKSGQVYQHYVEGSNNRNVFYDAATVDSSITFVFNPQPYTNKNFLTVAYEGSNGWEIDSFVSDLEGYTEVPNNYNDPLIDDYEQFQDTTTVVRSYYEGAYDGAGNTYPAALTQPIYRAGFHRKENRYVANLVSSSAPRPGEVVFNLDKTKGYPMSGIKAYVATIKMSTDGSTDLGGTKQLYAASTGFVVSSS